MQSINSLINSESSNNLYKKYSNFETIINLNNLERNYLNYETQITTLDVYIPCDNFITNNTSS